MHARKTGRPGENRRHRPPNGLYLGRLLKEASDLKTAPILLIAVALISGCGKKERAEGLQLAKSLKEKQSDFLSANKTEADLVGQARVWCASIVASGAGRAEQLDQNAAVAAELAKSVAAISAQLSGVRAAVSDQPIEGEFPMAVRGTLITKLTKRQRSLEDLRSLLQQIAPQFLEYKSRKNFAGDSYPGEIEKLDALLKAYGPPDDAVGEALKALTEKYGFAGGEI